LRGIGKIPQDKGKRGNQSSLEGKDTTRQGEKRKPVIAEEE
jgi:hypothetical protein